MWQRGGLPVSHEVLQPFSFRVLCRLSQVGCTLYTGCFKLLVVFEKPKLLLDLFSKVVAKSNEPLFIKIDPLKPEI